MSSIQAMITRSLLKKSGIWHKPLHEIRAAMAEIKGGDISGIAVDTIPLGGVSCEVFRRANGTARRTVLYFHGGGFCLGVYPSNRAFVAGLSTLLEADVYMPDYRLAPEHPYPAALQDAQAVYSALCENSRLVVMGDSSGCALALSALQGQNVMPQAIVMLTPVLDLSEGQPRIAASTCKDPFSLKDPLLLTKNYTAGSDTTSPLISPIYGNPEGLAPLLIHAAQYDVFLGDALRFAKCASAAGIDVHIKIWKKMWHIFHMQSPFVPEAVRALAEIRAYINTL